LVFVLIDYFHANYSRPNVNKNQVSVLKYAKTLLEKTCDLIRNFPEYLDVVVSVARKTDGRHWADLFSAAGRSTEYVLQTSMLFILISSLINIGYVLQSFELWSLRKIFDGQTCQYHLALC